ncbi:Uncharacterised protein [Mycobacteroides abscessus]|nr:Uncharacterised protein [Mycobacteroides abscessus]SHW72921.1 Uncharacterised protein [Mycobacteroides abscessus subsp. abscessus]SKT87111.1 Uncharacterised protein [Mycobacteroides abscessus subsp. abscessus]
MMTAAWESPSLRVISSAGRVPGITVKISSPSTSGVPVAAEAALNDVTPGMMTASNLSVRRRCICI